MKTTTSLKVIYKKNKALFLNYLQKKSFLKLINTIKN